MSAAKEAIRLHRYRVEKGIYPERMRQVVTDLCDEMERLLWERDEIDRAFYNWRQNHAPTTESALQRTTPEVCPTCEAPINLGFCDDCRAVLRPPTPEGDAE